ncbi:ribonuclease P protein subunit p40-like [Antedon mediterranea]|uniref:ribonuclease P protein subunit p40-like n=1 Tax=Antedon mediterranea TaxID=105859 RepID=UPI003AF72FCC
MNFPVPSNKLIIESSSFRDEKSRHEQIISDHYFNYSVDLLVPNCSKIPESVISSVSDSHQYFVVHDVPISELVKALFVDTFHRKGYFSALSYNTKIDTDNVASVLPTGKLVLSVSKDIYEELGIVGRSSVFDERRKPTRFIIEIDLLNPSFQEGKKNYEHVQWCFKDRLDLVFTFMVTWQPNDFNQTDLLEKYFKDYTVQSLSVQHETTSLKNLQVPVISSDSLCMHPLHAAATDKDTWIYNATEIHEWIGAIACKCQCSGEADSFLNTYHHPEPSRHVPSTICARWKGFIASKSVSTMLKSLRSLFVTNTDIPWIAMSVHGFMDSPVSWKTREHGFHKFGDNLYTYVVFPDDRYILYTAIGTNDVCP